jgi:type IV pilus assembly protein PilB
MSLQESLTSGLRRALGAHIAKAQGLIGSDPENIVKNSPDEDVRAAIGHEYHAPLISIPRDMVDPEIHKSFDKNILVQHRFMPLRRQDSLVLVASSQPWNVQIRDAISSTFAGDGVYMFYVSENNLQSLFDHLKVETESYAQKSSEAAKKSDGVGEERGSGRISLDVPPSSRTADVLHRLLQAGIDRNASDIHLHPDHLGRYRIRMEINGILQDLEPIDREVARSLEFVIYNQTTTMFPDKRMMPQDGNIQLTYQGQNVDCRIASLPNYLPGGGSPCHITIRLQNSVKTSEVTLEKLGFDTEALTLIKQAVSAPGAFCVVSGPTGSGKTTTLGACLKYLNRPDRMIYSVEDPVENFIPGVSHVQVLKGTPFADVLRSLLRKKPDVILIGEIRDEETASIAMQAALTGHTVLTTVHADFAYEVPSRLSYIGVKPYQIAQKLKLCSSQRLLPLVCEHCSIETPITPELARSSHLPQDFIGKTYRQHSNNGCSRCNKGYSGRQPIIEVIPMVDTLREMISEGATTTALRDYVTDELKVVSLRERALRLVASGHADFDGMRKVLEL